nr:protein transport protein SEC24-like At4g32640 [Tanacetum cinerariifolium]
MILNQRIPMDTLFPLLYHSSGHLSSDGVYLLENGEDCFIYVGGSIYPDITQKLFGDSSFSEIPSQVLQYKQQGKMVKHHNLMCLDLVTVKQSLKLWMFELR